jgi:hypothetical protein
LSWRVAGSLPGPLFLLLLLLLLLLLQTSSSRRKAVRVLKESGGDLINAIMAAS